MFAMEIVRLIERCRQGDLNSLGELYEAYAQRMRGVCRQYISDKQMVEDVLHDAFVIIFTSLDRLRDARRAESWMMAIVRNVASKCKDHLDALPVVPLEETSEAGLVAAENEEKDVRGVPLSEVMGLIDKLPDGYAQVFRLSVFEGMTHKEIATMMDIEPHSSSSQLSRAKRMLRKMMQQYWALLLLLLVPLAFFLFQKEDDGEYQSSDGEYQSSDGEHHSPAAIREEKPMVANTDETTNGMEQDQGRLSHSGPGAQNRQTTQKTTARQRQEPVPEHMPDGGRAVVAEDTRQPALMADSITPDTLSNMTAQDSIFPNTRPDIVLSEPPLDIADEDTIHHDFTKMVPQKTSVGTSLARKWSFELAYTGQFDNRNRFDQPYSFKTKPTPAQPAPEPAPEFSSSIDNWGDYASYVYYHPDAVSEQTRDVIVYIAMNNANRPGDDKILRTSHHSIPITWSLALKYDKDSRWGMETGLNYSKLYSEFEMGEEGYTIEERQTIHYIGIPVKGTYNMYDRKPWVLYGSLGLTTEIPVSSTLLSDYYVKGQLRASDKTSIHVPCQLSTTFGFGLQYHLTPNIGIFAEPSLQYFIPTHTDIETYRTVHPFTFSLPMGIKFSW